MFVKLFLETFSQCFDMYNSNIYFFYGQNSPSYNTLKLMED